MKRHELNGWYLGYELNISRESSCDDWYIIVKSLSGSYCYDGWWRDSASKTLGEAIDEAIKGSHI